MVESPNSFLWPVHSLKTQEYGESGTVLTSVWRGNRMTNSIGNLFGKAYMDFDWKHITCQLAEKREGCRWYRSRRRTPPVPREREPFYGVFEPYTRTVSVNDPDNIAGVSAARHPVVEWEVRVTGALAPWTTAAASLRRAWYGAAPAAPSAAMPTAIPTFHRISW
jgi:hypothetical protein